MKLSNNKILNIWSVLLLVLSMIPCVSFAQTDKINAGLLSDIWFSSLNLEYKKDIDIYASFQNTSDKKITGIAEFIVDEKNIGETSFEINSGSIGKISHTWNVRSGTFDIIVRVKEVKYDGESISINRLVQSEAATKIKVSRDIDIEYVKEVGGNVVKNVFNTINNASHYTNEKLESLKTSSGESSDVLGVQYQREEDAGVNNASTSINANANVPQSIGALSKSNVARDEGMYEGGEFSSTTITGSDNTIVSSTSNSSSTSSTTSFKNMLISILQFILLYWYIFLPLLTILVFWFLFKHRD